MEPLSRLHKHNTMRVDLVTFYMVTRWTGANFGSASQLQHRLLRTVQTLDYRLEEKMIKRALALPVNARTEIHSLGYFVQSFVDRRTNDVLAEGTEKWQRLFEEVGDMAYGKFNALLFQPLRRSFADVGLKAVPWFPGSFQSSREWGNEDETHQQRWFTTRIRMGGGAFLGTLAVGAHHDHSMFRLPRPPEILALSAVRPADIVASLAETMPEYGKALIFRDWYAAYMAAQS